MKVLVFTVLCNIFLSGYMYKNKTDPFQTKQKTQLNKNKTHAAYMGGGQGGSA